MASIKRGAMVASMLILVAIIASACNQPYSTPPSITSTPINSNSLFQTPLATNMTDVQSLATASALALSGTPISGVVVTAVPGLTDAGASMTPTTIIQLPTGAVTTPTATMALSTGSTVLPSYNTSQPPATSVPGTRPASYTLQSGEFVYCIARRFNINPDETLSLNGLYDGQMVYPGLVLKIPQTGSPFPGDRMLQNHPTTYVVASSNETLSSIACKFGDVDPNSIASANGLSAGAALTAGQSLSIP
ncbi:MAG: LysM peptidoglycan-binding domain-containing protein [Syntrophothermus sp.]